MRFTIRNQANISNKYLRFAKWKIRKLSKTYGNLLYSDIFVKEISAKPQLYAVTVRMGVPGPDIIVSAKSNDLNRLWSELSSKMKRQLRKYNTK
jgi:ribosome-associated translation inhibitor RaiA